MHRATRIGIAISAFIIAAAALAMAADPPVTLRITLKNGRTWEGTLVEAHDRWLILDVDGREVYCYRSAIVQTEQRSGGSYQPVPIDGNPTLVQTKRRRKSDMYLYVNFCSGGFNICSMSDKYSELMGQFHGNILYNMLGGQFTISPEDGARLSGNGSIGVGFYPLGFLGVNAALAFFGKGDKIQLISEGYETVNSETAVVTMEIPVTFRLRVPREYSAYIDLGVSYGRAIWAEEAIVYHYEGPGDSDDETENWLEVDPFDAANVDYYNQNDFSLVIGCGVQLVCMYLEYRLYYGFADFAKDLNSPQYGNIESRFATHCINFGFDYYFKLSKR